MNQKYIVYISDMRQKYIMTLGQKLLYMYAHHNAIMFWVNITFVNFAGADYTIASFPDLLHHLWIAYKEEKGLGDLVVNDVMPT